MPDDPSIEVHREWLGYVQPVGLLVAPSALVHRGVLPDRNIAPLQEQLDAMTRPSEAAEPVVPDFPEFARAFLEWGPQDLAGAPGGPDLPESLGATLIEYNERLVPTYAVPDTAGGWQMLVKVEAYEVDLDHARVDDGKHWPASAHARFERLLRETNIPVGLLSNARSFRLVYAPKGETSGFATFDLDSMLEVAGRPMLSAFHMLLKVERFFGRPEQNLTSLLAESRQYQETVSTKLAMQVLIALNELLRGFATSRSHRQLTLSLAKGDPEHLYSGLLTALLRLVFILYAEDRDLFPRNDIWEQNYSLGGLFERLRDDAALYPDTMDDRYGAWGQLLALWRLIYGGGQHDDLVLVARRGQLFDPDRFPFIEGRSTANEAISVPSISDGVVWRVLQALMVLDGERLSYRTLDVEQIGSVYQSVMGFTVELTTGMSVSILPPQASGAAATIDLEALLAETPATRPEWIRQRTDRKVSPKVTLAVKSAWSTADLEAALASVVATAITSKPLPSGEPVLQPTETRRRSGTHYTPRALTAPIVTETLRPVFERLGPDASADDVLAIRVLDPALGSGAFLVEACRQLADRVVAAWERDGQTPRLPADEDAALHARRLVAQRCLYGVDRNAMAADLAKLSLWLATLAKDHEFTFLDHAIRHGDALVGLSLEQIEALDWQPGHERPFDSEFVRAVIDSAAKARDVIRVSAEGASTAELQQALQVVEQGVEELRLVGNALVAAFFAADKPAARKRERQRVISLIRECDRARLLSEYFASVGNVPEAFHWPIEFPEVFERENPGFDAIVGNPPYAGKNTIAAGNHPEYIPWLQTTHEGAHGNADLVAHFFRRAFGLLRQRGTVGFVATNTICQGDTRVTGLRWLRHHEGVIYNVTQRFRWPGEDAAPFVRAIHISKGHYNGPMELSGRPVTIITAFLFDRGGDDNPARLAANAEISFQGSIPLGMGFTFDDQDRKGVASPLAKMETLIASGPGNAERIKPYIIGKDVLSNATQCHRRYVIDFGELSLEEAAAGWADLLAIVREKVKPQRDRDKRDVRRERWWRFAERSATLYKTIAGQERVLVTPQTSKHFVFTFLPNGMVYDQTLYVFSLQSFAAFGVLQSLVHETWSANIGGLSRGDTPRYMPSDVFETFPFPERWNDDALENVSEVCYKYRAKLMIELENGLTSVYNRLHDPLEHSPGIIALREFHANLDRAVLDAYGWSDIPETRVFECESENSDDERTMRFRWPAETRDEVVTRLLALNADRANNEQSGSVRLLRDQDGLGRVPTSGAAW